MNKDIFDAKVEERGLKLYFVAEQLGISPFGLAKKRNGTIPWKVSEINTLTKILHLTASERDVIFGLEST